MSGRPQCRALYDFQAENPDELSFSTGQVIDIVSQENSDWWTGILNGREGIFPANYVELIPQVRPSVRVVPCFEFYATNLEVLFVDFDWLV